MGSPPSDEIEEITLCARCRQSATDNCSGCRNAPDAEGGLVYTTWYCSPECQQKDWRFHKYACKEAQARGSLYRVGGIIQLAFYAYSEKLFDVAITKVEKEKTDLLLHQGPNDQNSILPFPNELFQDEGDKLAALTMMKCGNTVGFARLLLETMLPGKIKKLGQVDIKLKRPSRHVILISPIGKRSDNTGETNSIIQVTLSNGDAYAIDISSAQYGCYEPVTPWRLYVKSRVKSIVAVKLLPSIKESNGETGKKKKKRNGAKEVKKMEEEYVEVTSAAIEAWQIRNMDLNALLKLREGEFEDERNRLLTFIVEKIEAHKADMVLKGRLKVR